MRKYFHAIWKHCVYYPSNIFRNMRGLYSPVLAGECRSHDTFRPIVSEQKYLKIPSLRLAE